MTRRRCRYIRTNLELIEKFGQKAFPAALLLLSVLILTVIYSYSFHQRILIDFAKPVTGDISIFYEVNGEIDLLPHHSRTVKMTDNVMGSVELPFRSETIWIKVSSKDMLNNILSFTIDGTKITKDRIRVTPDRNMVFVDIPPTTFQGAAIPLAVALACSFFFFLGLVRRRPRSFSDTLRPALLLGGKLVVFWGIVFAFTRFDPQFLGSSLDQSWEYAMNEAIATGMNIGRDIIFTFGPYADIYSQTYHPGIVWFALLSKLFLGLAYACLFCLYSRQYKIYWQLLFMALLLIFSDNPDAILYTYPLLWGLYVFRTVYAANNKAARNAALNSAAPWIYLLSIPLGMLILVKGTLIGVCGGIATVVLIYFIYLKRYGLAAALVAVPSVSCLIFWVVSGQKLLNLPYYFLNISPIISGYTPAMSLAPDNSGLKQALFLLISLGILWSLTRIRTGRAEKVFIIVTLLIFLFVSFKGGFVRHSGYISAEALICGCCLILPVCGRAFGHFMLFCSFVFFLYIDFQRGNRLTKHHPYDSLFNKYKLSIQSACNIQSWKNHMQAVHNSNRRDLRLKSEIPELPGTTDLYPQRPGMLFATDNTWNPRPVFQSYSAYTQKLMRLNEEHLRSSKAPDNIIFELNRWDIIDFRLPSLEDGCSWPALLDNYRITKSNHFVYFKKKERIEKTSTLNLIFEKTFLGGQPVPLPYFPKTSRLYAKITMEPTLLGAAGTFLCRTSPVILNLLLNNGRSDGFRVIPEMMKCGFFISPLISTQNEFVDFHGDDLERLNHKVVRAFTLEYDPLLWKPEYHLTLMEFVPASPPSDDKK